MKILKFGGSSVGSAAMMKKVCDIITMHNEKKIVVLSAMYGTTDKLVEISDYLMGKNYEGAIDSIIKLNDSYEIVIKELFSTSAYLEKASELLKTHFNYLKSFTQDLFTIFEKKSVLAQGELISTALFQMYLEERNIKSVLLPALNFMRIDKDEEPDSFYIKESISREISNYPGCDLFITQGFICRNSFGEIDNLKRGGSDYSASIIGMAVSAQEVQLWSDIDGMHNNDPRYVKNTIPLSHISFDEAAELAYFGAKILHPSGILPAKLANIPVRLKNTMQVEQEGTLISSESVGRNIKAIAAKDKITAVKIKSGRMLMAYGFMRKIFEVFELYRTSIDMITTSEVAVSLTIDDTSRLEDIVKELKKYGTVEVDDNLTIICIVGDFIAQSKGIANKIFDSLKNIPIRMISYGGSRHNISLVINTEDKKDALVSLNENLFSDIF